MKGNGKKRKAPSELRRATTVEYIPFSDETKDLHFKPTNAFVTPLLTDLYQVTMAYAYWKGGKHNDHAVFELFFRKNPFHGEFTVYAGLEEVLRYVSNFKFKEDDIEGLKPMLPDVDEGFWEYLLSLDSKEVKMFSPPEGTIVFPRMPLIQVEGPLAVCQLLETTLLTLVNYPSLVATNAARHRLVAGPDKTLLEFGLRRAQGPDGGISASRYSYLGGFDGTSNVLAARLFGAPARGTHAHSFVQSFVNKEDINDDSILNKNTGETVHLLSLVLETRKRLKFTSTNLGELCAFVSYALGFPEGLLALVDTYDTLKSGVPNFLCVASVLHELGYKAVGIRLDSGDLAYLSRKTREMFVDIGEREGIPYFSTLTIVASNDINESTLASLNAQGHEIDAFGVGTNLVTCQAQPALGCVYKLVQINDKPRIKLSQEVTKITLPSQKNLYRLWGGAGHPVVDLMTRRGAHPPSKGKRILCRHPFDEKKRAYVTPTKVEHLNPCVWDGSKSNPFIVDHWPTLEDIKTFVQSQISSMRPDHLRILNPTPYKVSVTSELFSFVRDLWQAEAPIPDLDD